MFHIIFETYQKIIHCLSAVKLNWMSRILSDNHTWRFRSGVLLSPPRALWSHQCPPHFRPGAVVSNLWAVGGWQGTPSTLLPPDVSRETAA